MTENEFSEQAAALLEEQRRMIAEGAQAVQDLRALVARFEDLTPEPGPPGPAGADGAPGAPGPAGPPADLTAVEERLAELDRHYSERATALTAEARATLERIEMDASAATTAVHILVGERK